MHSTTPERTAGWLAPLLFAMLCAPAVQAQSAAPIELTAERAEVNQAEGVSTYRGNVVVTRGPMRMTGDVMVVHTDAQGQLARLEMQGAPATWRERRPGEPTRRAEAPRIVYYTADPERIVLSGGGRLWQGENRVAGETITHYPAEGRTIADGDGTDGGRVSATVQPRSDADAEAPSQ